MAEKVESKALEQMKQIGGTWAAYQNLAMDSADLGHLKFLKIGPGCTFQEPPKRMPDTPDQIGWRYGFIGWVNTETGEVEEALHRGLKIPQGSP